MFYGQLDHEIVQFNFENLIYLKDALILWASLSYVRKSEIF